MPKRKIKKEPFENWTCKIILKKVYNENFSWDELSEYFDKDPDYLYRILKEFFAKRGNYDNELTLFIKKINHNESTKCRVVFPEDCPEQTP